MWGPVLLQIGRQERRRCRVRGISQDLLFLSKSIKKMWRKSLRLVMVSLRGCALLEGGPGEVSCALEDRVLS